MLDKREFYINGEWVAPAEARDHEVIDPSTEEACAVISLAGESDVDKAVAAAKAQVAEENQLNQVEADEVGLEIVNKGKKPKAEPKEPPASG